jgi:hypothetical protein
LAAEIFLFATCLIRKMLLVESVCTGGSTKKGITSDTCPQNLLIVAVVVFSYLALDINDTLLFRFRSLASLLFRSSGDSTVALSEPFENMYMGPIPFISQHACV